VAKSVKLNRPIDYQTHWPTMEEEDKKDEIIILIQFKEQIFIEKNESVTINNKCCKTLPP
jgi:hypothetical protein